MMASLVSHIMHVVVLLAVSLVPISAFGDERALDLRAGQARVSADIRSDKVSRISVIIDRASNTGDILVAPVLWDDQTIPEGKRYEFLPIAAGRKVSAEFMLSLGKSRELGIAVVWRNHDGSCNREGILVTLTPDGTVTAKNATWACVSSSSRLPLRSYAATVRPSLHQWLGQGHCLLTWTSVPEVKIPLSWVFSEKRSPIKDRITNRKLATLSLVPLCMNNEAVSKAETGDFGAARKELANADLVAELLGIPVYLRSVIWLNEGLFAYSDDDRMTAFRFWRKGMQYPKEHAGVAAALSLMVRRRAESLQVEVLPDVALSVLGSATTKPAEVVGDFLAAGSTYPSALSSMSRVTLSEDGKSLLKDATLMAGCILVDRMHVVVKKASSCTLAEISLRDGSVITTTQPSVTKDASRIEIGKDALWVQSRDRRRLTVFPLKNGTSMETEISVPLGQKLVGEFFDGDDWYNLTSEDASGGKGAKIFLQKYSLAAGKWSTECKDQLPGSEEVIALLFAGPRLADVLTRQSISLAELYKGIDKLQTAGLDAMKLHIGGAADVPFLQLREAAKSNKVSYLSIYRRQEHKDRPISIERQVIRDFSGQAFGCCGKGSDVLWVRATNHGDKWILMKQTSPGLTGESLLTLALLDHRNILRGYWALPWDTREDSAPVIAVGTDRIAWIAQDGQSINVLQYQPSYWSWPVIIPQPQFIPPTTQRLIVPDVGHPGSYAVFGGPDGKKEKRIDWPQGLVSVQIGRLGQVAAACAAPPGKKPFVVFYDTEGKEIARIELPREPGQHMASLWVGDRGEALLRIAAFERQAKPGESVNPQTIYLNKNGTLKVLALEEPMEVFFSDNPGYAVLINIPRDGYELRRYATPDKLAWKTLFTRDQGRPSFLAEPKNGADVTLYIRGKAISYSHDGKELKK